MHTLNDDIAQNHNPQEALSESQLLVLVILRRFKVLVLVLCACGCL